MLSVSLETAKDRLAYHDMVVDGNLAQAGRIELCIGAEDPLAIDAWKKWSDSKEDRDALRDRITEIEDALRFNERLVGLT